MQNEKRQLQTALVVEQRVKRTPHRNGQCSFTENHSEMDSDTTSDDAEVGASGGRAVDSDDEDHFLDCEPSTSLEAIERTSLVPSTRSVFAQLFTPLGAPCPRGDVWANIVTLMQVTVSGWSTVGTRTIF